MEALATKKNKRRTIRQQVADLRRECKIEFGIDLPPLENHLNEFVGRSPSEAAREAEARQRELDKPRLEALRQQKEREKAEAKQSAEPKVKAQREPKPKREPKVPHERKALAKGKPTKADLELVAFAKESGGQVDAKAVAGKFGITAGAARVRLCRAVDRGALREVSGKFEAI